MLKIFIKIVSVFWLLAIAPPTLADFVDGIEAVRRQNFTKAIMEWEPLAKQGDVRALNALGRLYTRRGQWGGFQSRKGQPGFEKDFAANRRQDLVIARHYLMKARELGDMEAAHNLGYLSIKEQKPKEALEWWLLAAEGGYAPGQESLAQKYAGRPLGMDKALFWRRKAAEQGYWQSCNNLAVDYYQGRGVETDPAEAYKWFTIAMENVGERTRASIFQTRKALDWRVNITPNQVTAGARGARQWLKAKGLENRVIIPKKGTGRLFPTERVNRETLVAMMDSIVYRSGMTAFDGFASHGFETAKERVLYFVTRKSNHSRQNQSAYPALIRLRVVEDAGRLEIELEGYYAGSARNYRIWKKQHEARLKKGEYIVLKW